MKKKKIILIVILLIITLALSGVLIYEKIDFSNNDEEIIQSNERDETKEQFKVINEYINIRKENDSQSESLGKVYKDEIYTILDKQEDEYYVWYQIETNNGLNGYVAVKYLEESYIELLEVKNEVDNNEEISEE